MSATASEVAKRWFLEVWNERADALIPALMAEDSVGHLEGGNTVRGVGEFRTFQASILGLFPDIRFEVLRCIEQGEEACVLWEATGNNTGSGLGFAPTGRPISIRGMTWFRVDGGRIVEGWECWNHDGLFAMLAAGPP